MLTVTDLFCGSTVGFKTVVLPIMPSPTKKDQKTAPKGAAFGLHTNTRPAKN